MNAYIFMYAARGNEEVAIVLAPNEEQARALLNDEKLWWAARDKQPIVRPVTDLAQILFHQDTQY